ncbi:MAG: hypothetical protein IJU92_08520 [Spirochaetaceae bacterium]|nr:hypothetical protein [Spirochaetaceae bacterium]
MKKNYFIFSLLSVAALLFFGCKTVQITDIDPFGIIGDKADVYVFMPVDGNEEFLDIILDQKVEKSDLKTALSRTKTISAGIFTSATNVVKKDETLICAEGNYPPSLTGFIFDEKNGWKKSTAANGVAYYSGGINAVSIPNTKNTLLALASQPEETMYRFLERAKNKTSPGFSEAFERFVENPTKGTVGIFVKNPNFLFARILGTDLQLPLQGSEIFLKRQKDGSYTYDFGIKTSNALTAFGVSLAVRAALNAEVTLDGNTVQVKNGKLPKTQLSDMLKKLLP